DGLRDADGGLVERLLERLSHGHDALVAVVVIPGAPRLAVELERDWQILHARRGREEWSAVAGAQGGEKDDRLEGRSGLAPGGRDAIELAGQIIAAANESADLARRRLDHEHGDLKPPSGVPAIARRQARLQPIEAADGRRLRESLERQVERRRDADAAHARDTFEALLELLPHVAREVGR